MPEDVARISRRTASTASCGAFFHSQGIHKSCVSFFSVGVEYAVFYGGITLEIGGIAAVSQAHGVYTRILAGLFRLVPAGAVLQLLGNRCGGKAALDGGRPNKLEDIGLVLRLSPQIFQSVWTI